MSIENPKLPKEHDLSHERDARCVPLVKKIIEIMNNMPEMPTGSHLNEKKILESKPYLKPTQEVIQLFLDHNIKIVEIPYIWSLVRQALDTVADTINDSMNRQMNEVTELVYGLPAYDHDQITLNNLDVVLKNKDQIREKWSSIIEKGVEEQTNTQK